MPVNLSTFIEQASTADPDHEFVLGGKGELSTQKTSLGQVKPGTPDSATEAFIASLRSELAKVGGRDEHVRQMLANIGIKDAIDPTSLKLKNPSFKLTAGHVQALRIELAHVAQHGDILTQKDLARVATSKAGRNALAQSLNLEASGPKATLANADRRAAFFMKLAAVDLDEIPAAERPKPDATAPSKSVAKKAPESSQRGAASKMVAPSVPERASRKDLGRLEELASQANPAVAGRVSEPHAGGKFYVEKQQDSSCARHAINAISSGPLVSDESFTAYKMYAAMTDEIKNRRNKAEWEIAQRQQSLENMKKEYRLGDDFDTSRLGYRKQHVDSLIAMTKESIDEARKTAARDLVLERRDFDASKGNDHIYVKDYLNFLHDRGIVPNAYDAWSIDLTGKSRSDDLLHKVPKHIPGDRCIVTTRKPLEHHVAFVKDEDNDWWLLNSVGPKIEQISPQAYIQRLARDHANDTVGIIYQKPES
jgi:hypothetical protein